MVIFYCFHMNMLRNSVELRNTVLPVPDFSLKMSVFSFEMLFVKDALKANKM